MACLTTLILLTCGTGPWIELPGTCAAQVSAEEPAKNRSGTPLPAEGVKGQAAEPSETGRTEILVPPHGPDDGTSPEDTATEIPTLPREIDVEPPQVSQDRRPLIKRLSPRQRTRVYVALSVVVLLGAVMILVAWLGARATRRYMRSEPSRRRSWRPGFDEDDWARKPLVPHVDPDHEPPS